MKRTKIAHDSSSSKELFEAGEVIRKFKFAFAGTPEKKLSTYKVAKKKVASLLTALNQK